MARLLIRTKSEAGSSYILSVVSSGISLKKSREKFFHGGNIIVQDIPENTDLRHIYSDVREWKFIKQSLELRNVLTQQVVRLTKKDGDYRPRLM